MSRERKKSIYLMSHEVNEDMDPDIHRDKKTDKKKSE